MAKRVRKRHEDATAKLLLPSFRAAIREDQVKAFLDRATLIWLLRFPEPEEEVHVHRPFLDDAGYDDHIRREQSKVSTSSCLLNGPLTAFLRFSKIGCAGSQGFFQKIFQMALFQKIRVGWRK